MTVLKPIPIELLHTSAVDTEYPAWYPDVDYAIGDKVILDRYVYEKISDAVPSDEAWSDTTLYHEGERCAYGGSSWRLKSDQLKLPRPTNDARYSPITPDDYQSGVIYYQGDLVKVCFSIVMSTCINYIALTDNINKRPSSNPDHWKQLDTWASSIFYEHDSLVQYTTFPTGTKLYYVNTDITANAPDIDSENWSEIVSPEEDTDHWKKIAAANSIKMYDALNSTKTKADDTLTVQLRCHEADAVYFGGLKASQLTVIIQDATTLEVLEEQTTDPSAEPQNWLEYFSGSWMARSATTHTYWRTSMTRDVIITAVISNGGDEVEVGIMMPGSRFTTGAMLWDMRRTGNDYTQYVEEDDGSTRVSVGAYLPLFDIDCMCDSVDSAAICEQIEALKGTPVAIVANESGRWKIGDMFGVIQTYTSTLSTPLKTMITLECSALY